MPFQSPGWFPDRSRGESNPMKKEFLWDDFSPENKRRLRDLFREVAGRTVPLHVPGRDVRLAIVSESDFEFVLGNYSVEGERRAGGPLSTEESIMAASAVLRERLGLTL
jgi:hypothetical protein